MAFLNYPAGKPYTPHKTPGLKPGPRPIESLAKDYAEHMMLNGIKTAHVFPVLKSGRGHAADFRRHLAARLTGHDPDRPIWRGSQYIHTGDGLRRHFESRLTAFAFSFVEIETGDFL